MILCALPLANQDLAAGHDSLFHMLRIEAAEALREGSALPVRIYSPLLGGYRYACGLFCGSSSTPLQCCGPFHRARRHLQAPAAELLRSQCLTGYLAGRGITKKPYRGPNPDGELQLVPVPSGEPLHPQRGEGEERRP